MEDVKKVYISSCDTHHALHGKNFDFNYLNGFLLSADYIFSDDIARAIFDNKGTLENQGISIRSIINNVQKQYGNQPWLICMQCAKCLGLSKDDLDLAKKSTIRALSDKNELGHTPLSSGLRSQNKNVLAIGYSSRLIPSRDEMASLAVFYDEIWLPHPCDLSPSGAKNLKGLYRELCGKDHEIPQLEAAQAKYESECEQWSTLFDEGILKTMPPFERFQSILGDDNTMSFSSYISWFERLPKEAKPFTNGTHHLESLVLAMHRLDAIKKYPELFISNVHDTSTTRLSGYLNDAIITCRIPVLTSLNSDQILEIKEKVKDSKLGYQQYLNQLADDIEQRILSGNENELVAARKTAERKVIPEYENYLKQITAKEFGFGTKVLSAGGKFLQVDAAPWTPKFWGAIIECFSSILGHAADRDKDSYLSNEKQAFCYLATLERQK